MAKTSCSTKSIIAKLQLLKSTHIQNRTLRNNTLKFDKCFMQDMGMWCLKIPAKPAPAPYHKGTVASPV